MPATTIHKRVLSALVLTGVLLNCLAAGYVALYWWPHGLAGALGGALTRSAPFLAPLALMFFFAKTSGRYGLAILHATALTMVAFGIWRYADSILIQQNRKDLFLFDVVHAYQWCIAIAGALAYIAARSMARWRRQRHPNDTGASITENKNSDHPPARRSLNPRPAP